MFPISRGVSTAGTKFCMLLSPPLICMSFGLGGGGKSAHIALAKSKKVKTLFSCIQELFKSKEVSHGLDHFCWGKFSIPKLVVEIFKKNSRCFLRLRPFFFKHSTVIYCIKFANILQRKFLL